jgi:tRNA threonylcarbamoyladenosine biosynthesis protein TsaE
MNTPATDPLAHWRAGRTGHSAEETEALAAEFAGLLPPDTELALHGDLGVGKTTFVRGFARALGIREPVTSPTYSIFRLHRGDDRRTLLHMDAYRLDRPEDADNLLVWELLDSPWTMIVEWPSKLGDRLPPDAWHLELGIAAPGIHTMRLIASPFSPPGSEPVSHAPSNG